jgi:alpha-beta hydrolase superfamily lysophospholipase
MIHHDPSQPSSMGSVQGRRRTFAVALAGALLLLLGLLIPAEEARALRPLREIQSKPDLAQIVYENVAFRTADGLTLRGWFFPFQDSTHTAIPKPGPIVILPTDGSDNMASVLWHYAMLMLGRPYHAMAFDWRGFGESANWDIDTTQVVIPELITDFKAAVEYAKTRPEYDGDHIGVFACGPGAAVVLAAAATQADVDAIALRGVYTNQAEYCAGRRTANPPVACTANPKWPAGLEPVAAAAKVQVPVLLIVGEKDEITPPAMSQTIMKALAGPKELWIAPQAGHAGYESPEFVHTRPVNGKVNNFFYRHLGSVEQ